MAAGQIPWQGGRRSTRRDGATGRLWRVRPGPARGVVKGTLGLDEELGFRACVPPRRCQGTVRARRLETAAFYGCRDRQGVRLPLSEEEQRVLNEMEQTLYRHDPAFAARVKSESVYRYAGRFIRWSVVGFILGLVIMILWFTTSIVVGLLGVAIMFASLVVFSTNLRRVGKAGWQDITHSLRNERIGRPASEARDWFRSRFRRDK